ncbi:hypothetical protein [Methylobacter marinus]|uniref:hypothetical protein n=1 Tax=Methylobacter marinus TaxID=34058 RepID=UPI0003694972|nr:hypothetical protein [Methylobacter marinus]
MIVSLCSKLFDYEGDFLLDVDMSTSDLSHLSRRVSRTAALNGEALIVDNGYSASDATFILEVRQVDLNLRAQLATLITRHSYLTLSCAVGLFLGVVEYVDESRGFKLKFLVKAQVNE